MLISITMTIVSLFVCALLFVFSSGDGVVWACHAAKTGWRWKVGNGALVQVICLFVLESLRNCKKRTCLLLRVGMITLYFVILWVTELAVCINRCRAPDQLIACCLDLESSLQKPFFLAFCNDRLLPRIISETSGCGCQELLPLCSNQNHPSFIFWFCGRQTNIDVHFWN